MGGVKVFIGGRGHYSITEVHPRCVFACWMKTTRHSHLCECMNEEHDHRPSSWFPSPPSCRLRQVGFFRWAASRGGVTTKVYSFTYRSSQTERTDKLQLTFLGLQQQFGFWEILQNILLRITNSWMFLPFCAGKVCVGTVRLIEFSFMS